jgi:hypothetical protein
MRVLRPLSAFVAVLLLLAAPALAQTSNNDPSVDVTISVSPSTAATVALGGNVSFTVTVGATLHNYFCSQASTLPLALSFKEQPSPLPGISPNMGSAVQLAIGAQANSLGGMATTLTPVSTYLNVTVAKTVPGNHEHAFNVTASFAGQNPTNCQALSATAPPARSVSALASIKTGPPLGNTTTSGTPPVTPGGTSETSKKSPSLLMPVLVGVVGMAAAIRRRKA